MHGVGLTCMPQVQMACYMGVQEEPFGILPLENLCDTIQRNVKVRERGREGGGYSPWYFNSSRWLCTLPYVEGALHSFIPAWILVLNASREGLVSS
jgi:hypothetical protein